MYNTLQYITDIYIYIYKHVQTPGNDPHCNSETIRSKVMDLVHAFSASFSSTRFMICHICP